LAVEFNGTPSSTLQLRVADTAPGIFTLNTTGAGQAAVANQDGSFNGPLSATTRPAAPNSVIAVYMTGGGITNPPSSTGSVNPTNQLLRLTVGATASINGVPANVEFIGAAPGLVNGIVQANVRVPVGVIGNNLAIVISVGGVATLGSPTVAVQ